MRFAVMIVTLTAGLWCGCGGSSGSCTGTASPCASIAAADCDQQAGCDPTQSCDGLANACFEATDIGACGLQLGCSWNMVCGGTVVECADQTTSAECTAIRGCTWYDTTTYCGGVIPPCYTFVVDTEHDDCTPQAGCIVSGSCVGSALSCGSLTTDQCGSQGGCTLNEGCAGTATLCAELKARDQCAAQAGCSWAK